MRLVPKQLRRSDFPSSVPYYGGRLTPQFIAGMQARPPAPPPPADAGRAQLLGALQVLAAGGVLTQQEHADISARISGGG